MVAVEVERRTEALVGKVDKMAQLVEIWMAVLRKQRFEGRLLVLG